VICEVATLPLVSTIPQPTVARLAMQAVDQREAVAVRGEGLSVPIEEATPRQEQRRKGISVDGFSVVRMTQDVYDEAQLVQRSPAATAVRFPNCTNT